MVKMLFGGGKLDDDDGQDFIDGIHCTFGTKSSEKSAT